MHAPKGFGKRYFTLGAIQAYASSITLHRSNCKTIAHHRLVCEECDEEAAFEEDDPQLLETAAPPLPGGGHRPCHCNVHFNRLARRRLRSHDRPKRFISPYRYTRSTLSPPRLFPHQTHSTQHYLKGIQ